MAEKKLILVIGSTGAQGKAVISALLAPKKDGTPSQYAVRALTRDPDNYRAKELQELGCEIFKGSFMNLEDIKKAYEGCYGVFVNTDTQQVGEQNDVYYSIKLFELAKRSPTMKHFVYSGLDYGSALGNWDPQYAAVHFDAKGIFWSYLSTQSSNSQLHWTNIMTGPYMEMLNYPMYGPLNIRSDGTVVFASPLTDPKTGKEGRVVLVALSDIAYFTEYAFSNPSISSGQNFKIASEYVTWSELSSRFTAATGIPSVYKPLGIEEWLNCLTGTAGNEQKEREMGAHFAGMMSLYRDSLITRDIEWIRKVNPDGMTFEKWIKLRGYDGDIRKAVAKAREAGKSELKKAEEGKSRLTPNRAICDLL